MITVYLWKSTQSEPGFDGFIVDFTRDRETPPPEPERQVFENGLTADYSLYDDWQLVGEVDCDEMFNNYAGDNIVAISGNYFFAPDVYRQHRYRAVQS